MQIIIPGALPPHPVATELIGHIEKACPELIARFAAMTAKRQDMPVESLGCTPLEALELKQLGYSGEQGLTLGAGLGPLRAGVTQGDDPVLIADLCNIDIGSTGAQIAHPNTMMIDQNEADALFDSVSHLWADSGMSILPVNKGLWRVWLNQPVTLDSISPLALQGLAMRDWLPQHESLRPWRRLQNEIQTVWHDHPVNLARAERGERPINSLWLYGGGRGWKPQHPKQKPVVFEDLLQSHSFEDWASWLAAMPRLAEFLKSVPADTCITLLGRQHSIELTPHQRTWWQHLLPVRQQNWKSWWNLPN